ncbi:diacylglycerol/lipid kinase family protein [Fulvivirga aurantia]|uniref:diacylglycerol/lipid kinase family protein n=1 Tax=Fulvivirga aurantia TaxID=2529383 RepID=UPI0016296C43|nr:YegS/Rv2252/BmrU family lipid kinase [Fulvivirga aurantia]
MSRTKALFIINPNSGTRSKEQVPKLLYRYLDGHIDYDIVFTKYAGEATKISNDNKGKFNLIVAVGGDGTINEVARPLIDSETALGIVPMGSGNGLARHLGIPLNLKKAIITFQRPEISTIDTIKVDDQAFLNVAGVGFDAHIASIFAKSKKRGFITYANLALRELNKYRYAGYRLIIDGIEKTEKAPFIVSIANATQYGNNAHIAPGARIADGLMDICILQKVPFWYYPILLFHLFNGTVYKSRYYHCAQGKEVIIKRISEDSENHFHLDGDPFDLKSDIKLTIKPLSLKVACRC